MIRIITEAMSDLTREDAARDNFTLVAQPLRWLAAKGAPREHGRIT